MASTSGPAARFAPASSLEDVLAAWNFLHKKYVESGFISPNPDALHIAPSAVGEHATVMLAKLADQTIGTISTIGDNDLGLPMESVYPDELQNLRRRGARLVEIGLFADDKDKFPSAGNLLFDLMRFSFFAAIHNHATDIVCGVCPRHARVYHRILGFNQIGAETTYSVVCGAPVVLMHGNIQNMIDNAAKCCAVDYFIKNPLTKAAFADRFQFSAFQIATNPLGIARAAAERAALIEAPALYQMAG